MSYLPTIIQFQAPDGWVSSRLAVGSALFIGYFIHYCFLGLGQWGKVKKESLVPLQYRIHTFGIACLLSLSYAIFAWFTLVCLSSIHLTSIEGNCQLVHENKNGFWITYYACQGIWYFGIIVQLYQL